MGDFQNAILTYTSTSDFSDYQLAQEYEEDEQRYLEEKLSLLDGVRAHNLYLLTPFSSRVVYASLVPPSPALLTTLSAMLF